MPTRKELLARARWMRANPTEAEKRLWSTLRDRRLAAFKFRRQQVILPYIVDLVCFAERLIIEADGSQHADNPGCAPRRLPPRAGVSRASLLEQSCCSVAPEAVAACDP